MDNLYHLLKRQHNCSYTTQTTKQGCRITRWLWTICRVPENILSSASGLMFLCDAVTADAEDQGPVPFLFSSCRNPHIISNKHLNSTLILLFNDCCVFHLGKCSKTISVHQELIGLRQRSLLNAHHQVRQEWTYHAASNITSLASTVFFLAEEGGGV